MVQGRAERAQRGMVQPNMTDFAVVWNTDPMPSAGEVEGSTLLAVTRPGYLVTLYVSDPERGPVRWETGHEDAVKDDYIVAWTWGLSPKDLLRTCGRTL